MTIGKAITVYFPCLCLHTDRMERASRPPNVHLHGQTGKLEMKRPKFAVFTIRIKRKCRKPVAPLCGLEAPDPVGIRGGPRLEKTQFATSVRRLAPAKFRLTTPSLMNSFFDIITM